MNLLVEGMGYIPTTWAYRLASVIFLANRLSSTFSMIAAEYSIQWIRMAETGRNIMRAVGIMALGMAVFKIGLR